MTTNDYNIERLNFLIVDDNKHMRALVKSILHALGTKNILEAGDGADAFKELRHFPADMIICDWSMSPLDGFDFVRLVRTGKDSPNPFVPIIMLTGHTEMNRVLECRDLGVNEFLAKPISAKKLYARIRSILDYPREFIRIANYFGPDRRRTKGPSVYKGTERRKDHLAEVVHQPQPTAPPAQPAAPSAPPAAGGGRALTQVEIEALLAQ